MYRNDPFGVDSTQDSIITITGNMNYTVFKFNEGANILYAVNDPFTLFGQSKLGNVQLIVKFCKLLEDIVKQIFNTKICG